MNRRAFLVELVRPRSLIGVVGDTYEEWRVQRTVRLGAALAYYSLFAIVPIVSLTLAVLSAVFSGIDVDEVLNDIALRLFDATPPESFTSSVAEQLDHLEVGAGLGVLGFVTLLLAGSLVFVALADAAALIWEVPVRRGVGTSIRRRLLALAIVLGVGAVAIVAVVLRWVGGLLVHLVPSDVTVLNLVAQAAERAATVVVVGAVVALLFWVLAPTDVDWLPVLLGGGLSGLAIVVGTDLFGLYLDEVFATSLTGAAAGVLVFLLWTYSMAQVLLVGMHLTRTMDDRLSASAGMLSPRGRAEGNDMAEQEHVSDGGVRYLRTPDERFAGIDDFPYEPRYVDVDGLRMAWVEVGPPDADPILLLHGEPTWSFLYRRMIPVLADAGLRVVAPDLIGFGRSDKPVERSAYTYAGHVSWMTAFVDHLELTRTTLFGQDWGGLIGLRVLAENPERFARLVLANTVLPTGGPMSDGFMFWREMSQTLDPFDAGALVQQSTRARELTEAEMDAYRAPFPDESYMAGAREFPLLVPIDPDDPAVPANRAAWEVLESWTHPTLTLWGIDDPVLGAFHEEFVARIPGAQGQPHRTYTPAGHFIQDDRGEELAAAVVDWLRSG